MTDATLLEAMNLANVMVVPEPDFGRRAAGVMGDLA